jgi:hypothetical protein
MFFSFSSEIVMFTYGDFAEGRAGGTYEEGAKGATRLCSAPLAFGSSLRFNNHVATVRVSNAIQYLIRRVLDARIRLVELPGRLGRELAQRIAVAQGVDCFKYQFRPHLM